MKRIYSLNLIAYVIYQTDLHPEYATEDGRIWYAMFPECAGVAEAIRLYRDPRCQCNLHRYLEAYRALRDTIDELRAGGKNVNG